MAFKTVFIATMALAAFAAAGAHADINHLANGSFETGDFKGWTETGNTGYSAVLNDPSGAEDGSFYAIEGAVGSDDNLSQTFHDLVGRLYTVSGWMASDGGVANEFIMSVDGGNQVVLDNTPYQGWTNYSFTFVGSGLDSLTVSTRDDQGLLQIDNFSVSGPAPEPAAWALMLVGLGGVGVTLRRRRPVATLL